MSLNTKASNSPQLNTVSSFIEAPFMNVKNAASNVATSFKNVAANVSSSVKNTLNSNMLNNLSKPINESINAAMENESSFAIIPIVIILGLLLIFFILFMVFRDQIMMGAHIVWERIRSWFSPAPPKLPPVPEQPASPDFVQSNMEKMMPGKKQVFNVANNKYSYHDAEPVCKALGAELATYDQVKEAWGKGADWCNYGWVKGQAAVYPTQQSTFDKLQSGPEDDRMSCGTPGINGGYFDNPELKFGVNCYGSRPSENESDIRHKMHDGEAMTPDALAYNRKVQDYKAHKSEMAINPFKDGSWSE
jgi:hypothetical protein